MGNIAKQSCDKSEECVHLEVLHPVFRPVNCIAPVHFSMLVGACGAGAGHPVGLIWPKIRLQSQGVLVPDQTQRVKIDTAPVGYFGPNPGWNRAVPVWSQPLYWFFWSKNLCRGRKRKVVKPKVQISVGNQFGHCEGHCVKPTQPHSNRDQCCDVCDFICLRRMIEPLSLKT